MNERSEGTRGVQPEGRIRAKLLEWKVGYAGTGTEQIGVLFELLDAPWSGRRIPWYGTFTQDSFPITVRALKAMGWSAISVKTLKTELRAGTVVELVLEVEEYQGKERSRVQFVNALTGIAMKGSFEPEDARAFASKLQDMIDRKVHEQERSRGGREEPVDPMAGQSSGSDDDIPF